MPKYAMRGVADIIVIHTGRPSFLEVKRPGTISRPIRRNFRSSPDQRERYAVVRATEEVQQLGW